MIFVLPVEQICRVRTGEKGESVLANGKKVVEAVTGR
jgi:hypothetical protein